MKDRTLERAARLLTLALLLLEVLNQALELASRF